MSKLDEDLAALPNLSDAGLRARLARLEDSPEAATAPALLRCLLTQEFNAKKPRHWKLTADAYCQNFGLEA